MTPCPSKEVAWYTCIRRGNESRLSEWKRRVAVRFSLAVLPLLIHRALAKTSDSPYRNVRRFVKLRVRDAT